MRFADAVVVSVVMFAPVVHAAGVSPLPPEAQSRMLTAYQTGDTAAVRAILESSLVAGDRAPLEDSFLQAVVSDAPELVQMWLMLGANVDGSVDARPLCYVSNRGNDSLVRILIAHGADVNAATEIGGTPLIHASIHGHVSIVDQLLEHGATVDARDSSGATALYLAAESGQDEVVERLLEKGANPDVRSSRGLTPLLLALRKNDVPAISSLLRHGADPNVWGPQGAALDVVRGAEASTLLLTAIMRVPCRVKDGKPDLEFVVSRLRAAAERGDAPSQYYLARAYQGGWGGKRNPVEAARWYRRAAERGHAVAQHCAAVDCESEADTVNAVMWYRKAAEQGYGPSQNNLAEYYAHGWGVAQDHAEALGWYRKAAAQHLPHAQCGLGIMYVRGRGVAIDTTEAVKWFRLGAESGYALAQWWLGAVYSNGAGVFNDAAEGMRWFRKAAEQGDVDAMVSTGLSYQIGRGVPEDLVLAYAWFSLAAAWNDPRAKEACDVLAGTLSSEQLEEARLAARQLCVEMPHACKE